MSECRGFQDLLSDSLNLCFIQSSVPDSWNDFGKLCLSPLGSFGVISSPHTLLLLLSFLVFPLLLLGRGYKKPQSSLRGADINHCYAMGPLMV